MDSSSRASPSAMPSATTSVAQPSGATVEVLSEVFALLYAWCFVSSPDVPKQLKAHANWPANGKNTKWALVNLLEPAYRKALTHVTQPSGAEP